METKGAEFAVRWRRQARLNLARWKKSNSDFDLPSDQGPQIAADF